MNILSLFDGMSCGRIALERAGIEVDNYFSSEIKPEAIFVANKNYPQDEKNRLGDVTKIKGKDLPKIDMLIGGSPCQDFSIANKERKGLQGEKSSLFFEYVRILEETQPKYFLLENVRMKKSEELFISKTLGVEPVVINSSLVSPQLRYRLYWTNIGKISQPQELKIQLKDILTGGFSDRKKARALMESDSRTPSAPIKIVHRYINTGFTNVIFQSEEHCLELKEHFNKFFRGKSAEEIDLILENKKIDMSIYEGVRYLNRYESEACQTVPKGYTDGITEDKALGVLGDGWTVDVIAHIFRHITDRSLCLDDFCLW